jgi:hypothetical protein
MTGGGGVDYPEPTAEETGIQAEQRRMLQLQTQLLQGSSEEMRALAPILYQQMGLTPNYDPATGRLTGFTEDPQFTESQRIQRQLSLDRLRGEADLYPLQRETLEKQLAMTQGEYDWNARQQRLQSLLQPFQFEEMGLKPTMDASGNITGFEKIADPLSEQGKEIQRLQQERSLAALKGELPVDPALTRDLAEREALTRESLRRQLGAGYGTTTPGSEALGEFEESRGMMLDAARRGDMTLAESLSLNRGRINEMQQQTNLANMQGVGPKAFSQASTLASAFGGGSGAGGAMGLAGIAGLGGQQSGGFGSAMQNYQQLLGNFQQQRGQQFQGDVSKAQAQAAENQMYASTGTALAGTAAVVAALAGGSSRSLKRDVRPLGAYEESQTLAELMGDI